MVNFVMTLQFWAQKLVIQVGFQANLGSKNGKDCTFCVLGPKFGHLSLFKMWRSLDCPFLWTKSWEMWPEADLKHFRHKKKTYFGALESQFRSKKANF